MFTVKFIDANGVVIYETQYDEWAELGQIIFDAGIQEAVKVEIEVN